MFLINIIKTSFDRHLTMIKNRMMRNDPSTKTRYGYPRIYARLVLSSSKMFFFFFFIKELEEGKEHFKYRPFLFH